MKEWIPVISDDLYLHRDPQDRRPATATRFVGLDGRWVELDLDDEHDKALLDSLAEFMAAGRKPEKTPTMQSVAQARAVRGKGRRDSAYYEGLVRWVDENKITKRDRTGRPAYAGRKGRRDYPDWLLEKYDDHLAGTADEG